MKAIQLDQRVVAKANPAFCGKVIEAADDGQTGYVCFDGEEAGRTFFHADELEPEVATDPIVAAAKSPKKK